jgi:hypothetical protein
MLPTHAESLARGGDTASSMTSTGPKTASILWMQSAKGSMAVLSRDARTTV